MAFARLYISKFSRGSMPPDSLPTTLAATPLVGKTNTPLPKKERFLDPYAYDLAWYDKIWQGTEHPPPPKQKDGSFTPEKTCPFSTRLSND